MLSLIIDTVRTFKVISVGSEGCLRSACACVITSSIHRSASADPPTRALREPSYPSRTVSTCAGGTATQSPVLLKII